MSYEKKKNFIVNIGYYGIIAAIFFLVLKYGLSWFMPFVVAFLVVSIIRPVANKIATPLRINKKISACFCAAIFYGVTLILIILAGLNIAESLKNLFFGLPTFYTTELEPAFVNILTALQDALVKIDPSLENIVDDFILQISATLGSSISSISVKAITLFSGVVSKVPEYFIKMLITIIATFFIASDYDNIVSFVMRQLSEKHRNMVTDIKGYTTSTLVKYLKSYALILSVTFAELLVLFWLLKISNPLLLCFLIAILDILPVLGVGGVLIPWGILSIIQGKYAFGAAILIGYLFITVVRQIIEPKIIGDQVGMHPVATLVSMFIGARLFGIFGLFLFPISLVILKKLNDAGKLKIFK